MLPRYLGIRYGAFGTYRTQKCTRVRRHTHTNTHALTRIRSTHMSTCSDVIFMWNSHTAADTAPTPSLPRSIPQPHKLGAERQPSVVRLTRETVFGTGNRKGHQLCARNVRFNRVARRTSLAHFLPSDGPRGMVDDAPRGQQRPLPSRN